MSPILVAAAEQLTFRGYDSVSAATANVLPELHETIWASLRGGSKRGVASLGYSLTAWLQTSLL